MLQSRPLPTDRALFWLLRGAPLWTALQQGALGDAHKDIVGLMVDVVSESTGVGVIELYEKHSSSDIVKAMIEIDKIHGFSLSIFILRQAGWLNG